MKNINIQSVELKDGIYNALWSGYKMEIIVPNSENLNIETKIGIKGINILQKVNVKNKMLSTIK